ncbi:hypothetical protein KFU94_70145 [Chloroflexi bacterium TSY]|nr:hypothetical protein [Chloroflexi bacterium TSY]
MSIMGQLPKLVGGSKISHFTSMMHGDSFDEEKFDAELGFLLAKSVGISVQLSEDVILTERVLPPVETMATVVLVGGPLCYPAGFVAVGQWSEDNGYDIAGPQREIFLEIPASGKPDDMVIEIQFPVEQSISDPALLLSMTD